MMNTCYENHPAIVYECDECPLCVVMDALWDQDKIKVNIMVKFESLERNRLELLEADLEKSLKKTKIIQERTDMFVGAFEAPFAGEYKQPKLTIEKQGGTNE